MATAVVSVSPSTRDSGCIQVMKGSHKLGRLEHTQLDGQRGAEAERLVLAQQECEEVYCEVEAGDVLIFHCNTLHSSQANTSDDPSVRLLCAYNSADNPVVAAPAHPEYTPLTIWGDDCVREYAERQIERVREGLGASSGKAVERAPDGTWRVAPKL